MFMIIGLIIGVIIGATSEVYTVGEKIGASFVGAILGLICGILVSLFLGIFVPDSHIEYKLDTTRELVVLEDTWSSEGSFFLGCGTIDGEMYYSFYEKVNDTIFEFGKIEAEDVGIVYIDDDSQPRLERWTKEVVTGWKLFAFCPGSKEYIYVPEGTINSNYKLDAK